MNSVVNGKIMTQGLVDALYVPPCASDAGVALGAAYLAHKTMIGNLQRRGLETALLGPDYTDSQILEAIQRRDLQAQPLNNPQGSSKTFGRRQGNWLVSRANGIWATSVRGTFYFGRSS